MTRIFVCIITILFMSSNAMAETYSCKFSVAGAGSRAEFNGSRAVAGINLNGVEFQVISTVVKDSGTETKSIAIIMSNRGQEITALAPMGTPFVGVVDKSFGAQAICRLK